MTRADWVAPLVEGLARQLALGVLVEREVRARFRVNGPLANFPEFARIFACAAGSAMRPEKTGAVW